MLASITHLVLPNAFALHKPETGTPSILHAFVCFLVTFRDVPVPDLWTSAQIGSEKTAGGPRSPCRTQT